MPYAWRAIQSFVKAPLPRALPTPIPVVALISNDEDRQTLRRVAAHQLWSLRFAETRGEASALAQRLTAPVILLDRDWSKADWKAAVAEFAELPHGVCVILLSADDQVHEELSRLGGYELLLKPFDAAGAARVIRLAVSYWMKATRRTH